MPRRARPRRKRRAARARGWGLVALGPAIALGVAVAVLALDRRTGLGALVELVDATAAGRERVADLASERSRLGDRVRRLRSDPLELEVVAREQLGMVRPGEIVVRLPD